MNDICLNCGKESKSELWGFKCECDSPNVVHQMQCNGCENIIGFIVDDDFCGISKMYCNECMNKVNHK